MQNTNTMHNLAAQLTQVVASMPLTTQLSAHYNNEEQQALLHLCDACLALTLTLQESDILA